MLRGETTEDYKWDEEPFGDKEYVHSLHCGDSLIGVYIYQNLSNYTYSIGAVLLYVHYTSINLLQNSEKLLL